VTRPDIDLVAITVKGATPSKAPNNGRGMCCPSTRAPRSGRPATVFSHSRARTSTSGFGPAGPDHELVVMLIDGHRPTGDRPPPARASGPSPPRSATRQDPCHAPTRRARAPGASGRGEHHVQAVEVDVFELDPVAHPLVSTDSHSEIAQAAPQSSWVANQAVVGLHCRMTP
jgi:hypothetical protein